MRARLTLVAAGGLLVAACAAPVPPEGTPAAPVDTNSPTVPAASGSAPGSASAAPTGSEAPATTAPTGTGTGSIGGPGDVSLFDFGDGLAELASYTATLTRSFDGDKDGTAVQWSTTWTMSRSLATPEAELDVAVTGTGAPYEARHAWDIAGQPYEQDAAGCAPLSGPSDLDQAEPAGLLEAVIGAQSEGAGRYTFDQRALGLATAATATGEFLLASTDSGASYVAAYDLTTQAGPEYFGPGVTGTLTTSYELSGVNQPVAIELPAGCAVVPVEPVLMADATGVITAPGFIQYTTDASIDDVLAFYQAEAPQHGWTLIGAPLISGDAAGVLEFTTADGQLTVFATADESGTTVGLSTDQPPNP